MSGSLEDQLTDVIEDEAEHGTGPARDIYRHIARRVIEHMSTSTAELPGMEAT